MRRVARVSFAVIFSVAGCVHASLPSVTDMTETANELDHVLPPLTSFKVQD
jgi:hypothetical protein